MADMAGAINRCATFNALGYQGLTSNSIAGLKAWIAQPNISSPVSASNDLLTLYNYIMAYTVPGGGPDQGGGNG